MRRNWWFVWVEVAVLAVALLVSYKLVMAKVDGLLSPYLAGEIEQPAVTEATEEEPNIVDKIMSKAESIVGKKIKEMKAESEKERPAVNTPLS